MSNYIPWYGKKREHLARRERALIALLRSDGDAGRILKAAEEVRAAKIRAIRAQQARYAPAGSRLETLAHFDREIEQWLSMPIAALIESCRGRREPNRPRRPRRGRLGGRLPPPPPPDL